MSVNLQFIIRDGKRILQQEVMDPVLLRKVWKDVPLKETEDLDPGFGHPPTGGLAMDHLDAGGTNAEEDGPLVSLNGTFQDWLNSQ